MKTMKNGKLVSAFVALILGTFVGSAYPADEHPAMGSPTDESAAGTVSKPAKSVKKKKSVKSHDPKADEVQGRQQHPAKPQSGTTIKSHDPAASEVTGRSEHPAKKGEGSDVKSAPEGQQHDRTGPKN